MNHPITRRNLLLSAATATPWLPATAWAAQRQFAPRAAGWRSFEVTPPIVPADLQGVTRVWVPVPDIETDYQRTLGHQWSGNASSIRLVSDARRGVRMLYAEFPVSEQAPRLELVSRLQTRDRSIDWSRPARMPPEDPAVLRANLQPTEYKPLDGIVRRTALEATRGARTDVDKARAIYRWVVANAHREPKVRGCGTGDIRTMLEMGDLGGKCADLTAIFVGLCRAVGVPARDLYGIRVAPSAFGYRELGANPAKLQSAQHCRAEVYLAGHGWVGMDPADVLKVMRQETPEWIKDPAHPLVAPVNRGLFGNWEGNWMAYNTASDLRLPGSAAKGTLPFLMYPQGENASGRYDELAPDHFRYTLSAKEITV